MRLALLLVAILALAGCTMPGRAVPTPTVDTTTVAGYRKATEARGEQIDAAIEVLHKGCTGGAVATCAAALDTFGGASAETLRLINDTKPPQGCGGLWIGYVGLTMNAEHYRNRMREVLATNDPIAVASAAATGYEAWRDGWASNANYLKTDPCK